MDKTWVHLSRLSTEYRDGARKFVNMAQICSGNDDYIICPCTNCRNLRHEHVDIVYEHLIIIGMSPTYTTWVFHGESPSMDEYHDEHVHDEHVDMLDTYRMFRDMYDYGDNDGGTSQNRKEEDFTQKLEDAESPLYPGCTKYTRLSAIVVLFNHKTANGLSDKSFSELLQILRDLLPENNNLPDSMYSTKKLLKAFDLGYEKIDACENDCCLFRGEKEHLDKCPTCQYSRWKINPRTNKIKKGVPVKVLRYFPIIPRFRRMFKSPVKAEQLTWHFSHHSQDGKMRHPVDSPAWYAIDGQWSEFASDARNLRLGLAADGFNPFRNLSTTHSCWPVILVTYNLPPWLCMLKENLMLTLLIPGPKQPGNDIDVYLEPLIEDLKVLWNDGVNIYDANSKSMFNLKAILMWTINDFPAYGNLAGCITKGKVACPICGVHTCSEWLTHSKKYAYMGHRRFLESNHTFQKKKNWFDGKEQTGKKPQQLTGTEVLLELRGVVNEWGKKRIGKKKKKVNSAQRWKKKSIFWDLPYWEALVLRHNLDVMHIEKNVCDSIINTLLNVKGKSKDGLNSRKDLQKMNIRHELHPQEKGNRFYLPAAMHTLSKTEKRIFCKRLFDLKLPDGYGSNIGNYISMEECKVTGLKSHDHHVLMQQLLSVALRGLLPYDTRIAIFRFSAFFNELCKKTLDINRLEEMENEIAETLCMLERFFPPSFFDIMVHLPIHLAREAQRCGPVQYRWMYPFERFMKVLKGYVRNRARPEGCIAECYLAEECMRFCGGYMNQLGLVGTRQCRNEDMGDETILGGCPFTGGVPIVMSDNMLQIAHYYVLYNTVEVEPYFEMHITELKILDQRLNHPRNKSLLQKRHKETFCAWLSDKIKVQDSGVSERLKWLAYGPRSDVMSYSGYIINGLRFRTKESEKSTQTSGVSIEAETTCRSSAKDTNQIVQKISYYGIIRDIVLLDYHTFRVPLFKCDWASIANGVRIEDGFTLVTLREGQNHFENDPFILASQAKQVFYARDNDTSSCYVVLKAPPRQYNDMELYIESDNTLYTSVDSSIFHLPTNVNENDQHVREGCEGILL